jgi:hypothetical protein
MHHHQKFAAFALGSLMLIGAGCAATPPPAAPSPTPPQAEESEPMTFFVTSANPGKGADLGGLAGADAYCQMLAENAGAGDFTWRAYLSAAASGTQQAVNARDRIGDGPWHNAKGVLIASSLAELHGRNNISKDTALTEAGLTIMGRGDATNMHDILTGSSADGTLSATGTVGTTCDNWTSSASGTGAAMVGHHDRIGPNDSDWATSWNSSHLSRGCSLDNLKSTGGAGLFYCFAAR